jgi:tetratricopeptide (TPR) repeat protein
MAQAQHNLGIAHIGLADWPRAESCLQAAIRMYQRTRARLLLAIASMDLGEAYRRQDRPEEAERLYREAIVVMEETQHIRGLAMAYDNLGLACAQQQKWALAEDYFCRSIALWDELGEPVGQANAEDNRADSYVQQHRWQEALDVLDSALERLSGLETTERVEDLLSDIDEHRQAARAGLVDESGS